MPCEFECKRPYSFSFLSSKCQFEGELYELDGCYYCRFHLPIKGKRGNASEKAGWDAGKINDFNEQIFKHIEKAKKEEQTADLTGVVFPGDIVFQRFNKDNTLPKICFHRARFNRNSFFMGTAFNSSAYFSEAKFRNLTNFCGATFKDQASFSEAKFSGGVIFSEAVFSNNAYFTETSRLLKNYFRAPSTQR